MRSALLVALMAVAISSTGCLTAVGQGLSTASGASPRFYELRYISGPQALDAYKSVSVQAFDSSPLLGALPPDMVADVQNTTIDRLKDSRMFESVSPTASVKPVLIIRGKFADYEPGGSALRAVGFAGNPYVTAQIELVDGDTGRVLGVAMVTGTVKSIIKTGGETMANGVAKAIRGLVAQHHSKPSKN
jgi:hypothetical protein